jgi:hypothetical protein
MGGWIDLCERHAVIERAKNAQANRELTKQADEARAFLAKIEGEE